MPSCRSAHGQGGDAPKTIVDDVFDTLPSCARVDSWNTKLYFCSPDSTLSNLKSLLNDKKGSCGDWARYFEGLCATQGIGNAKGMRGRRYVIQRYAPLSDGRIKWAAFITKKPGINATVQGFPAVNIMTIDSTNPRYPEPVYDPASPAADNIKIETGVRWYFWADHAIVFLQVGANAYLYDPSFEIGPKDVGGLPAVRSTPSYRKASAFRRNYFDSAWDYLLGKIYYRQGSPTGTRGVRTVAVPVELVDVDAASTPEVKIKWEAH
jgi:hypothetical protein